MKFTIDRPIAGSYPIEIIREETWDFSRHDDEERRETYKLRWVKLDNDVVRGWIDDDGRCHRLRKETLEVIEVDTLEELHEITVKHGKIVFGSFAIHDGISGWIEIYDDYRE